MHSTIARLSQLERAYLNAVFEYHQGKSSTAEDAAVSKQVFEFVKAGLDDFAAMEAGKTEATFEIWINAVDAADI